MDEIKMKNVKLVKKMTSKIFQVNLNPELNLLKFGLGSEVVVTVEGERIIIEKKVN